MRVEIDKHKVKNRIYWFCEEKVNAFSPTISPAPKSTDRQEIESLYEGLKFYIKKGISELVIQKKYMGSYCDIYLHQDIEQSYLVSRNGYKVKQFKQEDIFKALKPLHQKLNWDGIYFRLIQTELMPWAAMGKGLITNEYDAYALSHSVHLEYLKHSSLSKKIEQVKSSSAYQEFIKDKKSLTEEEFKKKYPNHVLRQYSSIMNLAFPNLNSYETNIKRFQKQLDIYGKEGELHFKPFNILKIVYEHGEEHFVNDNLSYAEVNDDDSLHLEFKSLEDFEQKFPKIEQWANQVNASNEEGVMIKPRKAFIKDTPPAFKVRNNDYLTLIYGLDFQDQLDYQLEKRKIGKKIDCSINDWMINWKLIETPYCEINQENYYYKNLVLDRIIGETIENKLDIRL